MYIYIGLLTIIIYLLFNTLIKEGFINTILIKANSSLITAKASLPIITTSTMSTAIKNAKIAIEDSNNAYNELNIAKNNADKLVENTKIILNSESIDNLKKIEAYNLTALNNAKDKKNNAEKEFNNAASKYNDANSILNALKSNFESSSKTYNNAMNEVNNAEKKLSDLRQTPYIIERDAINREISARSKAKFYASRTARIEYKKQLEQLINSNKQLENEWNRAIDMLKFTKDAWNRLSKPSDSGIVTQTNIMSDAKQILDKATIQKIETEKSVSETQSSYNNAVEAVNAAQKKLNAYDQALKAQKDATTALTDAIQAQKEAIEVYTNIMNQIIKLLDTIFNRDNPSMILANNFPIKGNERENYSINYMIRDWNNFTKRYKDFSNMPSNTSFTDKYTTLNSVIDSYEEFIKSKDNYDRNRFVGQGTYKDENSIWKIFKNKENTYINNNRNDAIAYGKSDIYQEMSNAWTTFNNSLSPFSLSLFKKYDDYIEKKNTFTNALVQEKAAAAAAKAAQENKDREAQLEAEFRRRLVSSANINSKWVSSAPNGCRNIITTPSTDQTRQTILCNENEYLSGYEKVTGYDAAPSDKNVTRDNIGQYLAYKYSCCTVPIGAIGSKGLTGLPGLDGVNGMIGDSGSKGPLGPEGPQGLKGPIGKKGESGKQGKPGIIGPPGPKGEPGKNIKVKEIQQVPGPMGPKGPDGPRGPMGLKGEDAVGIKKYDTILPPMQIDKISPFISLQNKIRHFLELKKRNYSNKKLRSPSMMQGIYYQKANY